MRLYASPDYANAGGAGAYARGSMRLPVGVGLAARLWLGYAFGPGVRQDDAAYVSDGRGRSYLDYGVQLEKQLPQGFSVSAELAGTSLNLSDGRGRSGSQPKLIVSVTRNFDF